ncbi:amidohydrolase family protein [Bradyrhizobium sp. 146]|uniref:amidohydrolase family protein n=1 Tax=Bradyrhizobium sp. 146 TaxID=2782622 RepID=UPI001FFB1844|nr:amidohydrolase family protein [Bradyrhizobium sp. 146]MCK1699910.1 amidohydrolase family protein [Bradyrhizobium sp. 146]
MIGATAFLSLQSIADSAAAGRHGPPQATYDLVIKNVNVVDVASGRFVPSQDIAVSNGRILRVAATNGKMAGRRTIDGSNLIAMPGMVDTHTHLWQHVARGVASSSQLQTWTRKVYRLAHHASAAEVRTIVSAALGEALLNGITTVADFTSNNFGNWVDEATLREMRNNNVDGVLVWWRPAVFLPWQLQDRQISMLKQIAGSGIRVWAGIGPMSFLPLPASYDGAEAAKRNGMKITEHSMENLTEARDLKSSFDTYLGRFGSSLSESDRAVIRSIVEKRSMAEVDAAVALSRTAEQLRTDPIYTAKLTPSVLQSLGALADFDPPSPIPVLESWGILDGFLAIHGVWPAPEDIRVFAARKVSVSYNPESNMYLASGTAPIRTYAGSGVRVALGTDGAASNDRISMFDAMRAASMAQKVQALSPEATARLDDWFWIRSATIEGAAALGIADRTGSIEEGKEADIILLDRSRLGLSPFIGGDEGASALSNRASTRDIRFVLSNGHLMVDEGRLTGIPEAQRSKRLGDVATQLTKRAIDGSTWKEVIHVESANAAIGWWRYRSVRAADTVDVDIINNGKSPLRVVVGFSGTIFGGSVPATFHPESLRRFPYTTNADFYSKSVILQPKGRLQVERPSKAKIYSIRFNGIEETRASVASEQISIFAADGVDFTSDALR